LKTLFKKSPQTIKRFLAFLGLISLIITSALLAVYIGHFVILLPVLLILCVIVINKPILFLNLFLSVGPLIWTFSDVFYISIGSFRINTPIIIGGFIVIFYLQFLIKRIEDKTVRKIRVLSIFLIIFSFPSIFWSKSFSYGVGQYVRLISPYIILFSMYQLIKEKSQIKSSLRYLAFVTVATFLTLILSMFQQNVFSITGGITRISGSGLYFQQFAKFIAVNIQILLIFYTISVKTSRPLIFISFIGLSIMLYFTYHRTSWIIFAICIILGMFFFFERKIYKIISIGLVSSTLVFYKDIYNQFLRYAPTFDLRDIDQITSGRTILWQIYLSEFAHAPFYKKLMGIGYGDPGNLTIAYFGHYLPPHNDYIYILFEAGLISLILYVLILITLFFAAKRFINSKNKIISCVLAKHTIIIVVAIMVAGLAGAFSGNIMSSWYLYALFGIFLASTKIEAGFDNCPK